MENTTTATLPAPEIPAAPVNENAGKAASVTSLVLGIIALVLCFTFILGQYAAMLGLIAAVFGFVAARKRKRAGLARPMARSGMVLGLIALPLGFATAAVFVDAVDTVIEDLDESFVVLDAEWHFQEEHSDWINGPEAEVVSVEIGDSRYELTVFEKGTSNVIATYTIEVTDDGRWVQT